MYGMLVPAIPPPDIQNHLEWYGMVGNSMVAHKLRPNHQTLCRNIVPGAYIKIRVFEQYHYDICKRCA